MKKILFPIIVVVIVCFIVISCNEKIKKTDNNIQYDSLTIQEEYHLFNDTTKPGCNISMRFKYPVAYQNEEILKKMQRLFIGKFFGTSFENMSSPEAANAYKAQYISEFKRFESSIDSAEQNLSEKDHDDEYDDEARQSYYMQGENNIVFDQNNFLSFTVNYKDYSGGAHGSESMYAYVIDLKTGNLLTENDIFGNETQTAISDLIVHKIKKQNNISNKTPLEDLGFSTDEIVPNGNFYINGSGITYIYNQDEITSYIMGRTMVFLSYSEIRVYLNDNSPITSLWN